MLKKIISGGQTGADQGGLEIGYELGLQTGGTAPWNWMTAEGPKETLLKSYGLVAGPYDEKTYPRRTRLNVRDSDGTVIFGNTFSPGCILTLKYCAGCDPPKPYILNPEPEELAGWIVESKVQVLNVAGNREHTNPGIKKRTMDTIWEAYRLVKEYENGNRG